MEALQTAHLARAAPELGPPCHKVRVLLTLFSAFGNENQDTNTCLTKTREKGIKTFITL
jgi:hypothetical protein